jgi:hypothetical protein
MYNSKKENNDERWSLSLGSSRGKQAVSLPFSVNWKTSQINNEETQVYRFYPR